MDNKEEVKAEEIQYTDEVVFEIYDTIKRYFERKGYQKSSASLALQSGRMVDYKSSKRNIPVFPFILNRNYFIEGSEGKITYSQYNKDIKKYDMFIIEHITPMLLKHNQINNIQLIDSGKVKVINSYYYDNKTDKFLGD